MVRGINIGFRGVPFNFFEGKRSCVSTDFYIRQPLLSNLGLTEFMHLIWPNSVLSYPYFIYRIDAGKSIMRVKLKSLCPRTGEVECCFFQG